MTAPFSSDASIPLSVVVPTHGRVDLFRSTLDSLRRQLTDFFELIVTDDSREAGDRESISDAVSAYASATGRAARYVFTTPGLGQAGNTNQGLRAARGDLLRILHSDDVLHPASRAWEIDQFPLLPFDEQRFSLEEILSVEPCHRFNKSLSGPLVDAIISSAWPCSRA